MRIERINENQIRCFLNKEDLDSRHLKLSELAYGTENARQLFQEMMHWAKVKFDFQATDIPLMIEAVPTSDHSIVLILSKISYPEELDTRFSTFSDAPEGWFDQHPEAAGYYDDEDMEDYPFDDDSSTMPLFTKDSTSARDVMNEMGFETDNSTEINDAMNAWDQALTEDAKDSKADSDRNGDPSDQPLHPGAPAPIPVNVLPHRLSRMFSFRDMDAVLSGCHLIGGKFSGESALFHGAQGPYYLYLVMGNVSIPDFNRICNMLSEYGDPVSASGDLTTHFKEHNEVILSEEAVETLAGLC